MSFQPEGRHLGSGQQPQARLASECPTAEPHHSQVVTGQEGDVPQTSPLSQRGQVTSCGGLASQPGPFHSAKPAGAAGHFHPGTSDETVARVPGAGCPLMSGRCW